MQLLAKADAQAESGWLLKEGARAAEELLTNSGNDDLEGGNQMRAVFLEAIADHGSSEEKIYATAVREGSLQECGKSAVWQQYRAIQQLAAGLPRAYDALLDLAYEHGNLDDRLTLLQAAHGLAAAGGDGRH